MLIVNADLSQYSEASRVSSFASFLPLENIYPISLLAFVFPPQYVSKNTSELHQRAIPKQAPVLTIVDERDDSVERQVERVPTINPAATDAGPQAEDATHKPQDKLSVLKHTAENAAAQNVSVSHMTGTPDEPPHVQVETEEEKQARLDRQWKQLKVDRADLPDIYARLSKIKLTGRVFNTYLYSLLLQY